MKAKYNLGQILKCRIGEGHEINEIEEISQGKEGISYILAGGKRYYDKDIICSYTQDMVRKTRSKSRPKKPTLDEMVDMQKGGLNEIRNN